VTFFGWKKPVDWVAFSVEFNEVTGFQLSSSSKFDRTIYPDFSRLNQNFGLSAGAGQSGQFEKLVETEWFWKQFRLIRQKAGTWTFAPAECDKQ